MDQDGSSSVEFIGWSLGQPDTVGFLDYAAIFTYKTCTTLLLSKQNKLILVWCLEKLLIALEYLINIQYYKIKYPQMFQNYVLILHQTIRNLLCGNII